MQTAIGITGLSLVAFVILIYWIKARMRKIPVVADSEEILTMSEANFQRQLKDKVVLVDFWAGWCAPCRIMAPVLNEVANELSGSKNVGKVNIEQFRSLAGKYNIRSIPTMVLFKNGKEIKRFVGIKSKEFLLKQILTA
jgi:thioredoxin 1